MADTEVTITDNSGKTISELENAVLRGLEACGMTAETYAKRDAPVDTGRLRNSIAHKVEKGKEKAVYIGSNVEYAPHQEYRVHFLKNAAGNHTSEYERILKDSIKNA